MKKLFVLILGISSLCSNTFAGLYDVCIETHEMGFGALIVKPGQENQEGTYADCCKTQKDLQITVKQGDVIKIVPWEVEMLRRVPFSKILRITVGTTGKDLQFGQTAHIKGSAFNPYFSITKDDCR